jgi:hypothetical protein
VLPDDDPVMSSQSPVQMAMVTSRAYTLACWRHRFRHLHVAVPNAAGANAAATRAAYVHGAANPYTKTQRKTHTGRQTTWQRAPQARHTFLFLQ